MGWVFTQRTKRSMPSSSGTFGKSRKPPYGGNIRVVVPNIAQSILTGYDDRRAGAIPLPAKALSDGFHAHLDARTNVQGQPIASVGGQAERHRLSHVRHMHKITAFLAILEQDNFLALPDPIRKDRQYAGVGVVERLAFPINILQGGTPGRECQARWPRSGPDLPGPAWWQHRPMQGWFWRSRPWRRGEWDRHRKGKADPMTGLQAARAAHWGIDQATARAFVGAFAVNEREEASTFLYFMAVVGQHVEEQGGAHDIGTGVVANPVHGLPGSRLRGQMDHRSNVTQGLNPIPPLADIAAHHLDTVFLEQSAQLGQ